VLAPGIVLFLERHHFQLALGLYLFAAVSDVADGWIARATRQITRLGTVIDPVGDIVFNLAILWGLWSAHLLPGWVFAVGALRYGVLLLGGLTLHLFVGPVRIQPTWFGRATGVVMSSLIALLIVVEVAGGTLPQRLAPLTEIALGGLLVATIGQVLALGWYNLKVMTQPEPESGRVVGDVRWGRP
jgi:phosphatidylglycerophosphate synthase